VDYVNNAPHGTAPPLGNSPTYTRASSTIKVDITRPPGAPLVTLVEVREFCKEMFKADAEIVFRSKDGSVAMHGLAQFPSTTGQGADFFEISRFNDKNGDSKTSILFQMESKRPLQDIKKDSTLFNWLRSRDALG
jgi:hypothetical protein